MPTAQELFEDARMQGQDDALARERRKGKRELGRIYSDFALSNDDFEWVTIHYRKGYDEVNK